MKHLSLATVFAAISGLVVVWVAGWALDVETGYRYFLAYWGLFFACAGIVDGITLSLIHISEPTRRTERSRMPSSA